MDEEVRKPDGFAAQKLLVLPEYMVAELARSEWTRPLFVSDIGYFPLARHHYRERPDGCDSHIFIYCADGEGWIELAGERTMRMAEGLLAVIPAGTPHRYGASDAHPWSIYWFHLLGEHVASLLSLYGLGEGPIPLPPAAAAKLTDSFAACYRLLEERTYAMTAQVHVSHLMRELVSGIGMAAGGSPQDKKRERYVDIAVRYMNDRLAESVTLPELADHIGLSRQHLIHLFKRETGFPPIEYFLRLKMQRAAQLLDLTDLSVKAVGASVGFSDPYYFSRLFKKLMGVSPLQYRSVPKG